MNQRYCLVKDSEGHSYVVPVEMEQEFYDFIEKVDSFDIMSDEEYPDYDKYRKYLVNGRLTFTNPEY